MRQSQEDKYYERGTGLADVRLRDMTFRERLTASGDDGLSMMGDAVGHQSKRIFWSLVVGLSALCAVAHFASPAIKKNLEQRMQNSSNGFASRYDLDLREQTLLTAQQAEEMLKTLSAQSTYVKDAKSGLVFISEEAAPGLQAQMAQLSESWQGYKNSPDIQLIEKMLHQGASPKDIYKAFDGLVRRQEKRMDYLKYQPTDGAVSDLAQKTPPRPNLDSLVATSTSP